MITRRLCFGCGQGGISVDHVHTESRAIKRRGMELGDSLNRSREEPDWRGPVYRRCRIGRLVRDIVQDSWLDNRKRRCAIGEFIRGRGREPVLRAADCGGAQHPGGARR